MDGRKPALRHLFVAALACSGSVGATVADDFIRPPARSQPTVTTTPKAEITTGSPAPARIFQPTTQPNTTAQPLSAAVVTPAEQPSTDRALPTAPTVVGQPLQSPFGLENAGNSPLQKLPQYKSRSQSSPTSLAPPLIPSAREQAQREQNQREQSQRGQNQGVPATREQAAREQAAREQAAREQATRQQAPQSQQVPAPANRTSVPATTLNWQPRNGRGPNMHMSGFAQPSSPANGSAQLSLSESRPNSVFVAPQQSNFADEELPQVPPEAVEQTDSTRDVRLVMQPSAVESEQAEQLRSRRELAARISEELSAPRSNGNSIVASSIEPGPGWQAVGEELKQHLSNCEQLLSRKAYLSAMEESNVAILKLVRVLDLRQNQLISEPAWGKAQQALREAQEFTSVQRVAGDVDLFTRLIQSHETPTLHGANTRDLTPLAAAQHYRAYAERCLVEASQGHPWFSELYYCKGRALQSQAESGHPQADNMLQTALAYYRAARTIQPTNATNANQLGYVLLRMDRATEAMSQLAETVQLPNCPLEAWQNIAQASSRLGDDRTQQWALQNYANLKMQGVQPSGPINTLVELDPKQFAALSPPTIGPNMSGGMQTAPAMNYSQGGMMMAPAPAPLQGSPSAPNRTANTSRFGIFR